jgi:hypothetical protein
MRQIKVLVKFGKNSAVMEKDGVLEIKVNVRPEKGKANKQVIQMVAQYFDVTKNSVSIIKGLKSRHKIIQLEN